MNCDLSLAGVRAGSGLLSCFAHDRQLDQLHPPGNPEIIPRLGSHMLDAGAQHAHLAAEKPYYPHRMTW